MPGDQKQRCPQVPAGCLLTAARAEVRARCPPRVVPGQPRGSRGQGSRARKIWIARSSGWLLFSFFPSNCSPTNLSVTVSTVPRGGGGEGGWEVGTAGTGRIGAVPQGRSLSGVGSRPGVHGAKRGTAWSPWAAPLWGRPLCTAWDAPDLIPAPLNRGASPPCWSLGQIQEGFSSFHLPEDLGARKLSAPSPRGSLPAPLGKARSVPKVSPPFWDRAPLGAEHHLAAWDMS